MKTTPLLLTSQTNPRSIWRSMFAPVMELAHTRTEHPGYEDFILTRECDRTAEIASAPARKAWRDSLCGVAS